MRMVSTTWHLLCACACLLSCYFGSRQEAGAADIRLLKQVHDAERSFAHNADSDSPSLPFEAWGRLSTLEKRLLTLESGANRYSANYFCQSPVLKRDFDLTSWIADDTIHVTEAEYVPIICQAGQRLRVKAAWDKTVLTRLDFYLGNPGQMHFDAYKRVQKLELRSDSLHLPKQLENRDLILFAIVKAKGEDYRKFVFVIRPDLRKNPK